MLLLPSLQKTLPLRWVIIVPVVGSTVALFMNAMLAWRAIEVWPGVFTWPFVVSGFGIFQAVWYPPVRAIVAGIYGPDRFAVALGAVATVQAINSAVGPLIWAEIFSVSLSSASSGSSSGSSSCDGSCSGGGMPALVFYIASAWSALGCVAALTLPPLEDIDLKQAAADTDKALLGKLLPPDEGVQ